MFLIRDTFRALPGRAAELARRMRAFEAAVPTTRVLLGLTGLVDSVVVERQFEHLADFERALADFRAGRIEPERAAALGNFGALYFGGYREAWRVV